MTGHERKRKVQETRTFEAGCSMNGQGPSATNGHHVCTEKVPRRRRKSLRSAGTILAASSAWVHTRDHGGQCSFLLACLGKRGKYYMEKQEACTCFSKQHHHDQWSLKKRKWDTVMQHPCVYIWCVLGKCKRKATCKHLFKTMKGLSVLKAVTVPYALIQR